MTVLFIIYSLQADNINELLNSTMSFMFSYNVYGKSNGALSRAFEYLQFCNPRLFAYTILINKFNIQSTINGTVVQISERWRYSRIQNHMGIISY